MALAETAELAVLLKLKDELSGPLNKLDGELRKLQGTTAQVTGTRGIGGIGGALQKAGQHLGSFEQNLGRAFDHLGRGVRTAIGNIEKLSLAAGGLAIGGAVAAVKWAGDFEAQLHTINTVAGLTPEALGALGDQLRKIARDTGLSLEEITTGYYDLVSAGVKGSLAVSTLNDAVKLGIGGLATTGETIDLLTTAINAYGLDAAGAAKATDQFALAVADGKVKADQIAATFANVASIAKNYGVGIDQIAASFAFLTAQGVDASEVTTEMQRAIVSLVSPTNELEAAGKALGVSWDQEIRKKGLVPALQEIRLYSEKSGVPLNQLLGRIEAVKYTLQTTGPNFAGFNAEVAKMGSASGVAADQMSERQQGLNFELNRLKALARDAGITVGSALIPKITPLLDRLAKFLDAHQGDIAKFGQDIAGAFESIGEWVAKLDFGQIADDLRVAGTFARGIISAFLAAPAWLQTAVVTGWGLNKLTGGALTNITVDLAKGFMGQFLMRGSSPANPLWVQSVGGVGPGGGVPFGPPVPPGIGPITPAIGAGVFIDKVATDAFVIDTANRLFNKSRGAAGPSLIASERGLDQLREAQRQTSELAHLNYLQGEHTSYAGQTARSVSGLASKLDELHADLQTQLGVLRSSKDPAAQTAAAQAILASILKGSGGPRSNENILDQLRTARRTATDPALIKALDDSIAKIGRHIKGEQWIQAQKDAARKIAESNLPIKEKLRRLETIETDLKDHGDTNAASIVQKLEDVVAAIHGISLPAPTLLRQAVDKGNTSSSRERDIVLRVPPTTHRNNESAATSTYRWQGGKSRVTLT